MLNSHTTPLDSFKELDQYVSTYVPEKPTHPITIRESDLPEGLLERIKEDLNNHPHDFHRECSARGWILNIFKDDIYPTPWLIYLDLKTARLDLFVNVDVFIDIAHGMQEVYEDELTFMGRVKSRISYLFSW